MTRAQVLSSKRSVDKNPFLAKLGLDPIILETPEIWFVFRHLG